MPYPILYSFRRCPYAMRARLAIYSSGVQCELREVVLKDKPEQLFAISPKATVPVLHTTDKVIDESLDIMLWAIEQNDPQGYWQTLTPEKRELAITLIQQNDGEFKYYLDRYKYADRYPEHDQQYYRQQGELFLSKLESLLNQHSYLLDDKSSLADLAIFPFIRQFAFVDKPAFDQLPYPRLQNWLETQLNSDLFAAIMPQYPQWFTGDEVTLFPQQI